MAMQFDIFQDNSYAVLCTYFDYGLLRLSDLDNWLTAVETGQQGMLTSPGQRIPPVVNQGVRVCHALVFVFCIFFKN